MTKLISRFCRGALLAAIALTCLTPATRAEDMQKVVDNMVTVFRSFQGDGGGASAIPPAVLSKAYAVAVLDTTKGGLIFTGSSGDGVICARTATGWSGPYGLSTSGAGFGLAIGGEDIRVVLLVMKPEALKTIVANNNIDMKGMFEAAAGPTGVAVRENFVPDKNIYAYKVSDGVFAGAGFKGGVISTEKEETYKYYQQPVTTKQVLSGEIAPPPGATTLLDLLSLYPPAAGMPGFQNTPSPLIIVDAETLEVQE